MSDADGQIAVNPILIRHHEAIAVEYQILGPWHLGPLPPLCRGVRMYMVSVRSNEHGRALTGQWQGNECDCVMLHGKIRAGKGGFVSAHRHLTSRATNQSSGAGNCTTRSGINTTDCNLRYGLRYCTSYPALSRCV